jgi:hypothetical protein
MSAYDTFRNANGVGQQVAASSVPVVLASDQPALPVALGATTQLPTALGQGTMAQSLKVVVASDQSAVPVSNTQLPSSLGIKTAATSLSVTKATPLNTNNATYIAAGNMAGDIDGADITVGPEGRVEGYFSWTTTGTPIGRIIWQGIMPDGTTYKELPGSAAGFSDQPTAGAAGTCAAIITGLRPGSVGRFKYVRTSGGTANTAFAGQTSVS